MFAFDKIFKLNELISSYRGFSSQRDKGTEETHKKSTEVQTLASFRANSDKKKRKEKKHM